MKRIALLWIICAGFLSLTTSAAAGKNAASLTSREIVDRMLSAIDHARTLKFNLKTWERFGSKMVFNELKVTMNVSPFKMYMDNVEGTNTGVELLYISGKYDNNCFVNAGRFIPNLKLNPYGDRMRKEQHHTIFSTGFVFFSTIIKNALNRPEANAPGAFEKYCSYEGDITWEGKDCYKLVINDPDFHYENYTVKEGEDDVLKIENEKLICGYLIVEKNDNVSNMSGLKPGMQIKIPSSYAKKTVLYVDKATFLPIVQMMYDETGLFEKYEFHNLQVNPVLKENEFSEDNEDYSF